jgi:hypothetical protein
VGGAFELVYAFPGEALLEIANRTIHALLHISWLEVRGGRRTAVLTVYVKSRGLQGRAYMALIQPFRHLVVYRAWIEHPGSCCDRAIPDHLCAPAAAGHDQHRT